MAPIRHSQSGWSFLFDVVADGLVLTDVTHDGFHLATDIRVTRVWVDTQLLTATPGKNSKNFRLNDLPATPSTASVVSSLTNPSSFFKAYATPFGVTAAFKSNSKYLAGTPNECDLDLTEAFLFANYGKNPAHEPGGVLDATRIFPLLKFSFPPVKDTAQDYPKYFRADYRLDIDLDNIDEAAISARAFGTDIRTNKAAIFRDEPGPPSKLLTGGLVIFSLIGGSGPGVASLFSALEKPLQFEIASYGLVGGNPPAGVTPDDTWDNVHFWPAARRPVSVSTPGAFHAVHCHWRWGAVAGDPAERGFLIPAAGDPQFTGVGWTPSSGGALIDSAIPKQNLRFAVSKNDQSAWDVKKSNPSERDFKALFSGARAAPDDVSKGDNLVLWLSFEVFRDPSKLADKWEGSVFVNGIYFAHNQDNTPTSVKMAGAYGEAARPTPTRKWERLAR